MPEPFKNQYNPQMIADMAGHLHDAWSDFDKSGFVAMATHKLEALELKERSAQITKALTEFLPEDFASAVAILRNALAPCNHDGAHDQSRGITSWGSLPLNYYVAQNGLQHFDESMAFFKESTAHFSAEFDIRFFLIDDQERTLKLLRHWTKDPDYHVRRLVSEGTRPRLPWAMTLSSFIDDPSAILPLLEALKDDEEEYVRRSVANNLNDIAKDHPDLVASIAKDWLRDADKNRQRLVKHACRTLIKQGHKATLKALGYGEPDISLDALNMQTQQISFGDALLFDISLRSTSNQPQNLIIDYAIHHQKANGVTSPKVFKWKNVTLEADKTISARKKHAIKKITTRTYYNGIHAVEILVNGVPMGKKEFELHGVE